jgi:hypothetical protein
MKVGAFFCDVVILSFVFKLGITGMYLDVNPLKCKPAIPTNIFSHMKQLLLASAALTLWLGTHAQTTVTYNYTGTAETFTVPPCVTSVTIVAKGGQGGQVTVESPLPVGGRGATMQGDFAVNPGDVLTIVVGKQGNPDPSSSGGGGGSGVNNGSTPLIVAGGGGGVDFQDTGYVGMDAVITPDGVNGNGGDPGLGGTGGASGGDHMYTSTNISRGGNGWLVGPTGSTGADGLSSNTTWTAGTWGLGGGGGSVGYGWCNCGGGGGGYSGGGSADINRSAGGGGSYNSGTNQVNIPGDNTGDGVVTITYSVSSSIPASPSMITGTSAVCEGSSLLSYSIPTVAGATGYTWTVTGNSSIVSGQGTTAVDIQPGTGTATISVTADNTCGSSAPATFTLTIQPAPVIALGADITQCGGSVTLDAQNPGGTYFWSDASSNQTLVVSSSGSYWVNVTDANGCGAYDTIDVTINTLPTVALGNDDTICGGSITLDAQNAGSSYLWSDMSTMQTLNVSSTGTYSVTVTDANGCTGSDAVMITVGAIPAVTGTVPANVCLDDATVMIMGSPSGGMWSGPGVTGMNFDPMAAGAGTHQLVYSYTDMLGCTGTDTSSVFVDLCMDITSAEAPGFGVTPNPNNGSFVIEFRAACDNGLIELVDVTGKTVQSMAVNSVAEGNRVTMNCNDQPNGVYFVRVIADGHTTVKKIAIMR